MLLAIVAASCAPSRPAVALTVNAVRVEGLPSGFCQSRPCGGQCGDTIAPSPDAVTVPARGPLTIEVDTASEVHEIAINLFASETPTTVPKSFVLLKDARRLVIPDVVPGSYYLHVMVRWTRALDSGDQSYAFRMILRGT